MPLTDKQWVTIARDLRRSITRTVPDWSDSDSQDPGVTLLESLAFVAEHLQHRAVEIDERTRQLAGQLAERLSVLATSPGTVDSGSGDHGLVRVNYFNGMLLGVDDFRAEQQYFRSRLSRDNQLLHGTGIVSGLDVKVEQDSSGPRVTISPGMALDPHGNEIFVDQPVSRTIPVQASALLVLLSYRERPQGYQGSPAPEASGDVDETLVAEASRIAEAFDISLGTNPTSDTVVLARVQQLRSRWRLDLKFRANRPCGSLTSPRGEQS